MPGWNVVKNIITEFVVGYRFNACYNENLLDSKFKDTGKNILYLTLTASAVQSDTDQPLSTLERPHEPFDLWR
jgi:hypothetical protein